MPAKRIYVVETTDGLEYTFDDAEVHDVVVHISGALVVEGADTEKTHAFAPGVWVRWWIETPVDEAGDVLLIEKETPS